MQDNTIDAAIRGAAAAIEHLVRVLVRDELRRHLGPESEQLINVNSAPMSARKLRELIRAGELPGFKRGRDTFVRVSDFRSWIEGRPVEPRRFAVPEPVADPDIDASDELMVSIGLVPSDPVERRAFEVRLAQRRAEGGERAAALERAERERVEAEARQRRKEETRRKRAAKKKSKPL
jgi:helix-turn-helix protein